jgi:hypothetical protein
MERAMPSYRAVIPTTERTGMKRKLLSAMIVLLFPFLAGFGASTSNISLWDRMCAACHDGKTVLNGHVVIDKEQIKAKYKTIDELVRAVTCEGAPCMNILKHDKKLVRQVGKELGLK